MAFRLSARSLTPALRRVAHRQGRIATPTRRQFSSNAHSASSSGDTIWMIGSALVFVPTIVYLLSPSARSKPHQAHGATGHGEPHVPAENTPNAPPPVEPTKNEGTIADAEGTEVPVEEVNASITQAITQDAPKEAAQAEDEAAESAKFNDGAPGQTNEAEMDHEQKTRPHAEPKKGTLQNDVDTEPRPTDLGKAREQTTKASAPKEAVGNGDSK